MSSRSTWAWCRSSRSRCSRAPASAPSHSIIFGGFSPRRRSWIASLMPTAGSSSPVTDRLAARLGRPAEGRTLMTPCAQLESDGRADRRGSIVFEALRQRRRLARCLVTSLVEPTCDCRCASEPTARVSTMDSEDMLFLLYTSGSTGKPKGIVSTRPAATWCGRISRAEVHLQPRARYGRIRCTGARRTSAGSPDTVTSSTGMLPNRVPSAHVSKARRITPSPGPVLGRSSSAASR